MGKAHTWRAGLLLRDHVDVSVDGCDFASGFDAIMYVVFVLRMLRLPITVVVLQPW